MTERPDRARQDTEPTGRQRQATRQGLAYQGALEAVAAILIGAGIGYWIDGRFDTSPKGLLIGTTVGFGSFVLRLVRLGQRLRDAAQEDAGPEGNGGRGR